LNALHQLIGLLEEQHAYREGIQYAQRLLHLDSVQESAYQQLIRLHAFNGDRAAALRVYQECVAMLRREFGVEPSPDTCRLYQWLLADDSGAAWLRSLAQREVAVGGPFALLGGDRPDMYHYEWCAAELVQLSSLPSQLQQQAPKSSLPVVRRKQPDYPQQNDSRAWVVLVAGEPYMIVMDALSNKMGRLV
jgi:hypothetical protein